MNIAFWAKKMLKRNRWSLFWCWVLSLFELRDKQMVWFIQKCSRLKLIQWRRKLNFDLKTGFWFFSLFFWWLWEKDLQKKIRQKNVWQKNVFDQTIESPLGYRHYNSVTISDFCIFDLLIILQISRFEVPEWIAA